LAIPDRKGTIVTTIKATIQDRRLELDAPSDWPDGTQVEIHALENGSAREADTLSPEEIAATLAAMDAIEPFEMTEAERAAWDVERQARKDREKAAFFERADQLRRLWE
jgi:hypothetical protein